MCISSQAEIAEVIDLKEADSVPSHQRIELRIDDENQHFDEDYYL